MAGKSRPREIRPWERPPWPQRGDRNQDAIYAAVGRALSEWERYESVLSFLFANFVVDGGPSLLAATRSYSAVRTFEGRAEMLRAASEAFFFGHGPEAADLLQEKFKAILRDATCFAPRRNDIAHGVVDHYRPEPPAPAPIPAPDEYALFPAYATFRERDPESVPTYCYTSIELDYYRVRFYTLRAPAYSLSSEVLQVARAPALREKLRSLVRRSASRSSGQDDPK